ncbi:MULTISPECIES: glycogen synthase GlgA [unclassified Clostridium]|uniref:glycogen synthase GlgA n=1 Tax=unclassified Clostridium TaxID=2614128 RepID=UPI00189A67A3|nr:MULTISPECIES: glycogen synthase GlgA [unclassified Clostridium]
MRVLMVASEAHPFIKTGGLGDVMGALPQALNKENVEVKVILPKYKNISSKYINNLEFIKYFYVNVGWRKQYCGLFRYIYNGVEYYFIDNEYYFKRDNLYGYYDDAERFIFFDKAVLEFINEMNWRPDIIHCNDWQTGMVPVIYRLEYEKRNMYRNIKTFFSIHNLLFQGTFSPEILPELLGYNYEAYFNRSIELHGGVSFMKGGINYSDQVTTVSNTYAQEIQTSQYGERLEGLLRHRSYALKGILNGIDYDEYNPETDQYIYKNYSLGNIYDKKVNKECLQRELGLPINGDIPIIGMVSRLTHQKGCDLIINSLDRLLQKNIQVVILGTGDRAYEETLRKFNYIYHDKVSVNIKFSNELAHKIYAGSDFFLMPSLFEPCGLGQLIALRYGTIPIVRETGGLKDTVIPYNQYTGLGNGFGFRNYNCHELTHVSEYALNVYNNKQIWNSLIRQAMKSDNSWEKSAREYKKLYIGVINK